MSTDKPAKEELNVGRIKDSVEVIGKSALGIVAVCYVLGLIVVNLYLNKFGVYSLSLFRLNYVIAGVWSLVPYLTAVLILLFIFAILRSLNSFIGAINKIFNLMRV